MDEPQQRGGDSPGTLLSQIADCPAAIEGLSKARVRVWPVRLIVARNRNELEGNKGERDGEDSQRPGNQGVNDQRHDNGPNHSGRPHFRRQYDHLPQLPGGAQRYQSNAAQQYEGSAARQYQSIAAQHSQSNAAAPYWGNVALPPVSLAWPHPVPHKREGVW